jgi:signal peptidase I
MEPSYYRGDILFLVKRERVVPGDIIVYSLQNEAIPIVHRVTTVQELPNKEIRILTKGDNNPVDDRGLYPKGQLWLKEEQVMG